MPAQRPEITGGERGHKGFASGWHSFRGVRNNIAIVWVFLVGCTVKVPRETAHQGTASILLLTLSKSVPIATLQRTTNYIIFTIDYRT